MRDNSYRVLISIIAVWGAAHIPTMMIGLSFEQPKDILDMRYYLAPVALAMLPIAVIGICRVQRWGFIGMGVAAVLALVSYPPLAFFPILILLFSLLRFWLSRHLENAKIQNA